MCNVFKCCENGGQLGLYPELFSIQLDDSWVLVSFYVAKELNLDSSSQCNLNEHLKY